MRNEQQRRKHPIEFANFICKFGEQNLLDYAIDIVIPALTDSSLRRTWGDTSHFFHATRLYELRRGDDPIVAVIGQYVKTEILKSEQTFDEEKGLIEQDQQLPNAPSAYFALILNNHKLLYMPKTSGAPGTQAFGTTCENFIRKKHEEFLRTLFEQARDEEASIRAAGRRVESKTTLVSLYERIPRPEVNVVPLAADLTVEAFVNSLKSVEAVSFELLKTNHDLDNNDFFAKARKAKDEVNSTKTIVSHQNKDGLEKEAVTEQIKAVVREGNTSIVIRGTDQFGTPIEKNNDDLKIKRLPEYVPSGPPEAAAVMNAQYQQLVQSDILPESPTPIEYRDRIKEIRAVLRSMGDPPTNGVPEEGNNETNESGPRGS